MVFPPEHIYSMALFYHILRKMEWFSIIFFELFLTIPMPCLNMRLSMKMELLIIGLHFEVLKGTQTKNEKTLENQGS